MLPLITAGLGLATSLFNANRDRNRARDEEQRMSRIADIGRQTYTPYINRGNQSQELASGAYSQMLNDPSSFVEQIMASYQPSKGYDFRKKNAMNAARNSAAAGGFSGTYNDQAQQSELADGLLSQDMQQYLQNILGVHGTGLAGHQNVANMGYNAAGSLADYTGNAYGAQAQMRRSNNMQRMQSNHGNAGLFGGFVGQGLKKMFD